MTIFSDNPHDRRIERFIDYSRKKKTQRFLIAANSNIPRNLHPADRSPRRLFFSAVRSKQPRQIRIVK